MCVLGGLHLNGCSERGGMGGCFTLISLSLSQECHVTREFLRRANGPINLPEPLSQFVSEECQLASAQTLRTSFHNAPI